MKSRQYGDGFLPQPEPERAFGGYTYDPERDYVRLTGQLGDVFKVMKSGDWWTLAKLKVATGGYHSEAAISARIRDFRKKKYGGHIVERMSIGEGLFAYRLLLE